MPNRVPDPALLQRNIQQRLDVIRPVLADCLAREGDSLESCAVERVISRPYSTILVLAVGTNRGCKQLVAKSTAHHAHNQRILEQENQAVVEYEVLKTLHKGFEELEGCSVPCPLVVIPEIDTYLMRFVKGDVLADLSKYSRYLSSREKYSSLQRHYFLCGRWLRHFQQTMGIRVGHARAAEDVVQRCKELMERIDDENPGCRASSLAGQVMGNLEEELKRLEDSEVLVTGRHGDFGPWNVLANSQGISVIDFFGCDEGPAQVDALRMLVCLDDEKRCITSSAARVGRLQEQFLQGYGPLPDTPAALSRICETQQRLVSLVDAYSAEKTGMIHHRVAARLCIRAHLQWLSRADNKNLLWTSTSR